MAWWLWSELSHSFKRKKRTVPDTEKKKRTGNTATVGEGHPRVVAQVVSVSVFQTELEAANIVAQLLFWFPVFWCRDAKSEVSLLFLTLGVALGGSSLRCASVVFFCHECADFFFPHATQFFFVFPSVKANSLSFDSVC